MKINKAELEKLIMEELDDLDEGLWSTLKGYASGAGSFLSGHGYKRGKAASALKSASDRLEDVRWEFIDDIEGLFTPMGSDTIEMPEDLKDVQKAWNDALSDIERASDTLKKLSVEVKIGGKSASRRDAPWDRNSNSQPAPPRSSPEPSPAEE